MVESLPSKQLIRVRFPAGAFKKMEENNQELKQKTNEKSEIEKFNFEKFYNKNYKILLAIPLIFLIICFIYLYNFQIKNGDIILKDITLTGGTSIQINSKVNVEDLKLKLEANFKEISIREIYDLTTGEQLAVIVETTAEINEIKLFLEDYLGFTLDESNSSIEFTGSSLSESFYNQLKVALLISFILMSIVVFVTFRTFIPSIAVIFAALGDIIMTMTVVNILGMKVSTAGIVAFLMLISYSVDTDILLTSRVLKKKEDSVNGRIYSALKTGLTMTLTSLVVVIIGYFVVSEFSKIFSQIFTILSIGLLFDIFNTWIFNAGIIKWYAEKNN